LGASPEEKFGGNLAFVNMTAGSVTVLLAESNLSQTTDSSPPPNSFRDVFCRDTSGIFAGGDSASLVATQANRGELRAATYVRIEARFIASSRRTPVF